MQPRLQQRMMLQEHALANNERASVRNIFFALNVNSAARSSVIAMEDSLEKTLLGCLDVAECDALAKRAQELVQLHMQLHSDRESDRESDQLALHSMRTCARNRSRYNAADFARICESRGRSDASVARRSVYSLIVASVLATIVPEPATDQFTSCARTHPWFYALIMNAVVAVETFKRMMPADSEWAAMYEAYSRILLDSATAQRANDERNKSMIASAIVLARASDARDIEICRAAIGHVGVICKGAFFAIASTISSRCVPSMVRERCIANMENYESEFRKPIRSHKRTPIKIRRMDVRELFDVAYESELLNVDLNVARELRARMLSLDGLGQIIFDEHTPLALRAMCAYMLSRKLYYINREQSFCVGEDFFELAYVAIKARDELEMSYGKEVMRFIGRGDLMECIHVRCQIRSEPNLIRDLGRMFTIVFGA